MAIGKKFFDVIGFTDNNEYDEYVDEQEYEEYEDTVHVNEKKQSGWSKFRSLPPAETHQTHLSDDLKIVLLQPMRFEEAQTIARNLLHNKVVVFDLHECDIDVAMDIVNFVSGSIFALGGSIQKVNEKGAIFVAVPPSVSLENELRGGFSDGDYGPTIAEWVNHQRGKGDF